MKCPRCSEECERPTVDVGVGEVAVGPWGCDNCYWVEGASAEEQAILDAIAPKPAAPPASEGDK
jgi:hypothetical protein